MRAARWGLAMVMWMGCAAASWWLPQAFVWLVRAPWPWPEPSMALAVGVAVAMAATLPSAAVGWWIALPRRWVVRLVAIAVTWAALLPVPAFWACTLKWAEGDRIEWLELTADGQTYDVRVACSWHSWEEEYGCRARGYERLGTSRIGERWAAWVGRSPLPGVLVPVGVSWWTDPMERPRPEPRLARDGPRVVFWVEHAPKAEPIRFR